MSEVEQQTHDLSWLLDRTPANAEEDRENYRYGNFMADQFGPVETHQQIVLAYGDRLISEGWELVSCEKPFTRLNIGPSGKFEPCVTIQLRARRLRPDARVARRR